MDGDKGKVKNTHVINGVKSYIEGDLTLVAPAKVMLTYTFGGKVESDIGIDQIGKHNILVLPMLNINFIIFIKILDRKTQGTD